MDNDDIILFRKEAGGDCVYQNLSNIKFSFIEDANYDHLQNLQIILYSIKGFNIDAISTVNNDLISGDKLIAKSTYIIYKNVKNHPGTLYPNNDLQLISKYINTNIEYYSREMSNTDIGYDSVIDTICKIFLDLNSNLDSNLDPKIKICIIDKNWVNYLYECNPFFMYLYHKYIDIQWIYGKQIKFNSSYIDIFVYIDHRSTILYRK